MRARAIAVSQIASVALVAPGVAQGDAVTEWNAIASTAIVGVAGQPPHPAALSFAMVQGAVYDAVNAIDRGHQPYLVQPPSNPTDSKEAAAATAQPTLKTFLLEPKGTASYAEVAARLGVSEQSVKSAIHRLRRR